MLSPKRLLFARVEHASDQGKPRSEGCLADPQKKPHRHQAGEAFAGRMAHEDDAPYEAAIVHISMSPVDRKGMLANVRHARKVFARGKVNDQV
jgi:hypothetical protein